MPFANSGATEWHGMERPRKDTDASSDRRRQVLIEEHLTREVIGCFFRVHRKLRSGHLESVYRHALEIEMARSGVPFRTEVPLDVHYDGIRIGHFRADLVVDGRVVVELKASQALVDADLKQLLNYLSCTELEVGLLLHFGLKPTFRRAILTNDRKPLLRPPP